MVIPFSVAQPSSLWQALKLEDSATRLEGGTIREVSNGLCDNVNKCHS
jgi:hypothetical protein